jgi:hypothetical protein
MQMAAKKAKSATSQPRFAISPPCMWRPSYGSKGLKQYPDFDQCIPENRAVPDTVEN